MKLDHSNTMLLHKVAYLPSLYATYRANYDMLRYVLDHSAAKRFRLAGLGLKGESNLLSLGRTSERVRKYFKLKFKQNNCCKV